MGLYLSSSCPVANTGSCYYTPANTQTAVDCSYTSASPTVNCAGSHFVSGDVGKRIFGYQICAAFNPAYVPGTGPNFYGTNPLSAATPLTISTFNSATQVTLSGNAINSSTGGNTACFIWGNTDDAGAVALDAAVAASPNCQKVFLGAAYYLYTVPHHYAQPTACKNLPTVYPYGLSAGNMLYAAGLELEGRGTAPTTIFLTPAFPETGTCNFGLSGHGCFVVPTEGTWRDLAISGGGNFNAVNVPPTSYLVEVDGPATLEHFTCTDFASLGGGNAGNYGVAAFLWTQLTLVNISGCGAVGVGTNVSSAVTAMRLSVDNAYSDGIVVGAIPDFYTQNVGQFDKYNLVCYDCRVFAGNMGQTANPWIGLVSFGSKIKLYHSTISSYQQTSAVSNLTAYKCQTTANCVLNAEDVYADMSGGGAFTGTGYNGIICSVACSNTIRNSIFKGTSGGSAYTDVAGSTLNDQGGNTWGTATILGTLIADGHSINGACTGTTLAAGGTFGLYGTGPNITSTTCGGLAAGTVGSGAPMSAARTVQFLVVTASAAGSGAGSGVVTVLKNGVATAITCTIGTGTSCNDGTHSVSVVAGDLITIQFTAAAADTLAGVKAITEWN